MAVICNPNDEMQWPPVKQIVDAIDDLARSLKTPDYTELVADERRPYKFADAIRNITVYQAFDLNQDGSGTISSRYLSDDAYGDSTWKPPDAVLGNMAEDEDLFFVAEPDDCICKTIFQVLKEGSGFTLEKVDEMGCCQSLFVPSPGDTVPGGQNIVPSRPLGSYLRNGNPIQGERRYDGETCRANPSGVGYKFASVDVESPLQTVARRFDGYLTWMARADYMATMWDKIVYILDCCRNGGSEPDTWWDSGLNEGAGGYRETECSPSIGEILRTLKHEAQITSNPGCLFENDTVAIPWDAPTCGGQECDTEGPKFYCETLDQMDELIKKADADVRAYSVSGVVGCCCTPGTTGEGADGESTICAGWISDGFSEEPNPQCWVVERVITTVCSWKERSEPGGPFDVDKSGTTTETRTYSGEVIPGAGDLTCLLGSESETYEGDPFPGNPGLYDELECTTTGTRATTEPPTEQALIAAAIQDAIANGGPSGSVQGATTGPLLSFFGTFTPCSPGKGYATLSEYKITLSPPSPCPLHCNGANYSPVTVDYDLVLYVDGEESQRQSRSAQCNWELSENMFISSARTYPNTSATNFFWSIEFPDDDGGYLCLDC